MKFVLLSAMQEIKYNFEFIKNAFDEEFEAYKKKLEEIYDLCLNCKNKLKVHLIHLDKEIGRHNSNLEEVASYSKNKRLSILKPLNNVTNMIIDSCNQIKNGGLMRTAFIEKKDKDNNENNKKMFYSKANTIAGTIPPYSFNNNKTKISDKNGIQKNVIIKKYDYLIVF